MLLPAQPPHAPVALHDSEQAAAKTPRLVVPLHLPCYRGWFQNMSGGQEGDSYQQASQCPYSHLGIL